MLCDCNEDYNVFYDEKLGGAPISLHDYENVIGDIIENNNLPFIRVNKNNKLLFEREENIAPKTDDTELLNKVKWLLPVYEIKFNIDTKILISFCVAIPISKLEKAFPPSSMNKNSPRYVNRYEDVSIFRLVFNTDINNILNAKKFKLNALLDILKISYPIDSNKEFKSILCYGGNKIFISTSEYNILRNILIDYNIIKKPERIYDNIMKITKQKVSEMLYDNEDISSEEAFELDVYRDILVDFIGVSAEAVDMVIGIMGETQKTYDTILEYVTGYRNLSQID